MNGDKNVTIGSHAIVIGGGIAGLLTARVLTDYFEQVTIIERDHLPAEPVGRKGVPQARHLHFMLARGWMILEQLFPELGADLVAAGAAIIEWPADLMLIARTGRGPRLQQGMTMYSCSRNLLEWGIRQQVARCKRVRVLEAHTATGLLVSADRRSITGVRAQAYTDSEGVGTPGSEHTIELEADLVVDASGRVSQAPQWLETFGYPAPTETVIKPFVGYATRYYANLDGVQPDWKGLLMQSRPPTNNRSAVLLLVENNQWILTLGSVGGNYPPTDEDGFAEFIRSLPDSFLHEAIRDAQPASPIYSYRIPQNRMIHYEKMPRWPERFVVLGDATCTFNPVYGQGMAVGAQGVMALDECLREQREHGRTGDLRGLAHRFQQRLFKVISTPWLFGTSEDARYPTTEGSRRDLVSRAMQWYIDGALLYAAENSSASQTFIEVVHMLTPPTALFRPEIVMNALALNIERFASEIASYGKAEN